MLRIGLSVLAICCSIQAFLWSVLRVIGVLSLSGTVCAMGKGGLVRAALFRFLCNGGVGQHTPLSAVKPDINGVSYQALSDETV